MIGVAVGAVVTYAVVVAMTNRAIDSVAQAELA
jgi:hypothetical protein